MSRGVTRTTRKPSRLASEGRDGSWRDVSTVTSGPRAASSRDRERTWLSTPPRCGENHGETWAILTPRTSENPTARRDVPAGVRPRPEERFLPDDGARVDRRVDPDLHVVSHDHAELPESRVDLRSFPDDADQGLIEPEVRDFRSRTEIAPLSEDAVADVVLMGHVSARHQDGILHFTRVSDFRFRADRRSRPDVAVRADLRVRADDGGAFDVGAASDPRARLDEHFADEGRAAIHIGMARALPLREGDHGSADLPVVSDHRGECLPGDDHVAVHAQERAGDVGAHASDRMGGPEPLRLFLVCDRETEGSAVSEALANPMALPADEDRHLRDAGRTERLQRVPQKRFAGHREKGLREIGREGTHPGALSGREDHGLHSVAPFALDRTAEYISFALAASRDSAVRRIFDSVPEKRTRAQPSSNWSRHPSTVVTSPPSPRNATSRRGSIVFRLAAS